MRKFSLWLRKRVPAPLRRVSRVARAAFAPAGVSPWLPPDLLQDCKLCASRNDLVLQMPRRGRVAEVGVERGEFSRVILDFSDPLELALIDLNLSDLDDSVRADPRVGLHKGPSNEVLNGFADASFDWIYVDADHSYAGVARDAAIAASKVKPGGYLVFNDFAHVDPFWGQYGVHRAVTEFAMQHRWPFAWWAYQPHGLYDVALRRPL